MKKITSLIIVLALVYASILSASAHNSTFDLSYSASYNGWDIFETSVHSASYTQAITVNCGPFGANDFKPSIDGAIASWNDATFNGSDLLNMSANNTSGSVKFLSKTDAQIRAVIGNTNAWAFVYRSNAVKDNSGKNHYSTSANSVEIWVNRNDVLVNKSATCRTHTALHELGHVIGLKDIPATVSPNAYLMCNEFGSNYSVPSSITDNDKQGAAVILGQHTSHTYVYQYYSSTQHWAICSKCNGYKLETHTSTCNKC